MSKQEPSTGVEPAAPGSSHKERTTFGRSEILAIAAVVVILAGGIIAFFTTTICDEQATEAGAVLTVCRHLRATDPPVVAFGIVIAALLSRFFSEISVFGVSMKSRLARVEKRVASVEKDAESLKETADDYGEDIRRRREATPAAPSRPAPPGVPSPVASLCAEYNNLRATTRASNERTQKMTAIVHRMIDELKSMPTFDVAAHLGHEDRGMRLAAYAFLYDHPRRELVPALVDAVLNEDKPFGEYWGYRALNRQLEQYRDALDRGTRSRLEQRLAELGRGGDRATELQRALSQT